MSKKWTAAAAARYARDARAATVQHLREAEIARKAEEGRLTRALQVHRANLGSDPAATILLFGGLGYAPPYPRTVAEAAERVIADTATRLAEADLYILTPQMCDVVIAAAQTLKAGDFALLDPDDLPSPTGLVVLPYPLLVRSAGGDLGDDRAFCWTTPAAAHYPREDGVIRAEPAVWVSSFHDAFGPVKPDSFRQFAAIARELGTPLPPLLVDEKRCLPFHMAGLNPDEIPERNEQYEQAVRKVDGARRAHGESLGLDEDRVEGEYEVGTEIVDHDSTFTLRFLFAFWRLCNQRIGAVVPVETNHAASLAAQKTKLSADVRIVQLRKSATQEGSGEATRDWQHRWVVRMHRVRQWYPSRNRHEVIFRGPYVKGPADKPMLNGDVVRALVR